MALADRIQDNPVKPGGKPCSVGELEQHLADDEAAAFRAMMYELGWSQAKIYEAVKAEGHQIGQQTINRHRSRGCRCFQ